MKSAVRLFVLLALFALAILVIIGSSRFLELFPLPRPLASALFSIAIGFCFYQALCFLAKLLKIKDKTKQFTSLGFRYGFIFGFIAFLLSLVLFIANHKFLGPVGIEYKVVLSRILFEVRPAILEEIGFRFGLAFFAFHFYGHFAAIVIGSIPFGLLHLLNFISGDPIQWDYIIGTSVAGLFLTLVFLRFNLAAAITTHFTWNVFVVLASIAFSFNQQHLEAAPSTQAVLLLLSFSLLRYSKK